MKWNVGGIRPVVANMIRRMQKLKFSNKHEFSPGRVGSGPCVSWQGKCRLRPQVVGGQTGRGWNALVPSSHFDDCCRQPAFP